MRIIWIIDDNEIDQLITVKFLEFCDRKLHTKSFSNGSDVLKLLEMPENKPPSVILLNLDMPIMDGWEFLEKIKLLGVSIPIYIVSASERLSDVKKAGENVLVRGYIFKPFNRESAEMIVNFVYPPQNRY
jgi:CheY-like chemotaxis protein